MQLRCWLVTLIFDTWLQKNMEMNVDSLLKLTTQVDSAFHKIGKGENSKIICNVREVMFGFS